MHTEARRFTREEVLKSRTALEDQQRTNEMLYSATFGLLLLFLYKLIKIHSEDEIILMSDNTAGEVEFSPNFTPSADTLEPTVS